MVCYKILLFSQARRWTDYFGRRYGYEQEGRRARWTRLVDDQDYGADIVCIKG
jgi:hypothetical protein